MLYAALMPVYFPQMVTRCARLSCRSPHPTMTCALWLTPATAAPSRHLVAWQFLAFRLRHPDETGARNSHAAASCHVRCALGSAALHAMSLWDSRTGTFRADHSPGLHLHPAEARGVEVGVQQHVQVPACRRERTLTLQLADAMIYAVSPDIQCQRRQMSHI